MNKKALSLAVCLAVSYSSPSYALGLGEIESSSHLNQPFRAKIKLLSTTTADAKRLQVRVASPEVFSRVGIERPDYLNNVSFTPTVENGKPVIIVSSNEPINQPFLNFLIEVSWPNGQLLKEYTVLLDPPVLVQAGTAVANNTVGVRPEPKSQQPTPKAQPQQTATQPQSTPTKQTIATATPPPASTPKVKKRSNRTSKYRVVRGDTLAKIARKLRYKGVRKEQMMMALFRANPTAFRKRNINNLKAGALLRRPSEKEARELSYKQAKTAIYRQSKQWRSKLAKSTVPQSRGTTTRKTKPPKTQTVKNNQARIEVIGSSSSAVDTKNLSATGSAKIEQLERQLVQAKESLAAKTNANTELKSRVSELESLLRKKNRLITLKNEQLAELQARLGMPAGASIATNEGADISQQVKNSSSTGDGTIVRSGAPVNPEVATATDPAIANPTLGNEQQLAVVDKNTDTPSIFEQALSPETPESQATEGQQSNRKDETVVTPPQDADATTGENEGGVLDLLTSPIVLGLGGGSLLGLLLLGWLIRRKGNSEEYEEYSSIDFDDPDFAPGSASKKEKNKLDKKSSNDAFSGLEGDFDDLDFGDSLDDTNKSKKKDTPSVVDTNDDILQEADVYIVYGLHDQAEVELKKAIEKNPDNLHYHAKLLENYQVSGNLKAFDKQADIFSKLKDDTEGNKDKLWKKIKEWAKELKSESSLFADSSSSKSKGVAAAATAAVVAGGVAITAGKALAEEKQDNQSNLFDEVDPKPDSKDLNQAQPSKEDDLDLSTLDLTKNNDDTVSFNANDLNTAKENNFNENDLDLEEFLGDTSHDAFETSKSDSLDESSLDDLLADVESMPKSSTGSESLIDEEQTTELGSEFEDLLDLDLTGLSDDLSLNANKHEVSNLNLELDNDHDLNKILPSSSPYTSTKNDVQDTDNLLGDLDDDLSFMDLGGSDDDLKETQVSTKLDLARAYLDMGDMEGARNTLEEVMMEGNDDQKKEAEELLHQTG